MELDGWIVNVGSGIVGFLSHGLIRLLRQLDEGKALDATLKLVDTLKDTMAKLETRLDVMEKAHEICTKENIALKGQVETLKNRVTELEAIHKEMNTVKAVVDAVKDAKSHA